MHEKQILMQEWICMKCPHTSNVEGDQYFSSQHAWAFKFPDWQSNVHFPWPKKRKFVHILMASKFQSKLRVLDTLCKTKDFFVFCSGKLCLVCFHVFLFFCFICRLCQVHKINAQTPITANLSTYLIHEFIVNVKWRMDGSHRKPYICLSFDFLIQYSPMEHV